MEQNLKPGDHHYKAYVGPVERYDLMGHIQFNLLTALGLKSEHYLLDVGCGSLRFGKLVLPYLESSRYFGTEPNSWLIEEAIKNEIGESIVSIKKPMFSDNTEFDFSGFHQEFDFIIAQSIFSHASSSQIEQCLASVKQTLVAEGIFVDTFIIGKKDYNGQEWVYPGCVTYRKSTFKNLVTKAGLKLQIIDWYHPAQTWFIIYHPTLSKYRRVGMNRLKNFNGKPVI